MELTAPKKHVEFDFIFNQIFKEDLRDHNENFMLNLEKPIQRHGAPRTTLWKFLTLVAKPNSDRFSLKLELLTPISIFFLKTETAIRHFSKRFGFIYSCVTHENSIQKVSLWMQHGKL